MLQRPIKLLSVKGEVAPGYESVKELFSQNMHSPAEEKAQLCVYVKGEKVVDLVAAPEGDETFTADSLVNVWSSGKSLETIAMAHLVDKGLLDYNEKIVNYWPEFGNNGKMNIKVSDVLRHQAGLHDLRHTFSAEDFLPENIKQNSVGRVIENAAPLLAADPLHARKYHALSRGWVLNEIFRRIDPQRRTIGEYLREEISGPLGADAYVGVQPEELGKIHKMKVVSHRHYFLESLKSNEKGRTVVHSIFSLAAIFLAIANASLKLVYNSFLAAIGKRRSPLISVEKPVVNRHRIPLKDINLRHRYKNFNTITEGEYARGESSSFASKGSARGLAKIAAMLSLKGKYEGRQYLGAVSYTHLTLPTILRVESSVVAVVSKKTHKRR